MPSRQSHFLGSCRFSTWLYAILLHRYQKSRRKWRALLNRTWQGGPGNGLTGNQLGSRGYVSAAAPAFADDDALPTYNAYREALCVSTKKLDSLLDRHAAQYLRLAGQQPVATAGLAGLGGGLWKPGELK